MRIVRAAVPQLGLLLAGFFLGAVPAWAWGCKGHQTVALIAEKQLTPEARQFVDKLLADSPIDPQLKRYCGNTTRDAMADSSTWADDVRNDLKNGPWHYIDIPRGSTRGPLDQYCGSDGCVVKAIADQLAILKNQNADPKSRANALRYVIHFVGDLHMPLHATTNNDQGGNCVPVRYLRRSPHEHHNSYTPNLHAIWDTAIVERDMEGADPAEYADHLAQLFGADFPKWQSAGTHIDDWAWESYRFASTVTYGKLTPKVPVETPAPVHSCTDANNIGQRMFNQHLVAGQTYQQAAGPLVEKRLAQAGLRLALILNEAAGSDAALR
jgi:hypothetical protein